MSAPSEAAMRAAEAIFPEFVPIGLRRDDPSRSKAERIIAAIIDRETNLPALLAERDNWKRYAEDNATYLAASLRTVDAQEKTMIGIAAERDRLREALMKARLVIDGVEYPKTWEIIRAALKQP